MLDKNIYIKLFLGILLMLLAFLGGIKLIDELITDRSTESQRADFSYFEDESDHFQINDIVITSYSIHYTKLYDGLQTELGSEETVEVVSCGEYHFRNGKHFVIYEEVMDESSNHMDTKCLLKLSDKHIELLKKGDVETHMVFEEGKTHLSP